MVEKKLKCIHCGKILSNEDAVYMVTTVTLEGVKYYSPTCSEGCANMAKKKNIEHFQKIIDEIQASEVYTTNVKKYPCVE